MDSGRLVMCVPSASASCLAKNKLYFIEPAALVHGASDPEL
jgi:hypothetical protein